MNKIITADALQGLKTLDSESVHCIVTSPPYYNLRDYGVDGQIGLEETPEEYISKLVEVFHEAKRVLRPDGTLWLNIADSYTGSGKNRNADRKVNKSFGNYKQGTNKGTILGTLTEVITDLPPKSLIGIPWRLAFALQADGWILRQDIIWAKPNPMPESVTDRCTKSHEYIFLFSKSRKYYFDNEAIKEPCVKGEFANGFRGGAYCDNETFNNSDGGKRKNKGNTRYGGKKYAETPDIFNRTKSGNIYDYRPLRNKRDVWTVATSPYKQAHFATFPPELIRPCILAGSPKGGVVLDMFGGSGTTGMVAQQEGRQYILIDLNPNYAELMQNRVTNEQVGFKDLYKPVFDESY